MSLSAQRVVACGPRGGPSTRKVRAIGVATVALVVVASWALSRPDAAAAVHSTTSTASRAPAATAVDPETPLASDGSTVAAAEHRRPGVDGYRGTGTGRTPTVTEP